jgi:hypothetical protein
VCEKDREKRESGLRQKVFPALKVPRQCPFVLLVEVRLKEGKALGSEKGKF